MNLFKISVVGALASFTLFILSLYTSAEAINMTNGIYRIQAGNFNSFSGKATGGSNKLTFTSGESIIGLYSGTNYRVRAGFQYIYSVIPFTFSISNTSINFGTLTAGEPITRTNTLSVGNGSAYGYQVTASEDHELRSLSGNYTIPDTTCDSGNCTETTSAAWSSPLTYGFGYRCDNLAGTDCSSNFATSSYYKQFANQEIGETAAVVMSSQNVGRSRQTEITYKVNISATQAPGAYQNVIIYIATPTI